MQQVNIYRSNGEWCYALFSDGEYDCSDVLGIEDECSEDDASAEAAEQFPGATVRRVDDVRV